MLADLADLGSITLKKIFYYIKITFTFQLLQIQLQCIENVMITITFF